MIGTALGLRSQTTDTICFPVAIAKKVLAAAEQKKVLEQQVNVLNLRIVEKDSIISLLKFKDETNTQLIQTYEDELKVIKEQRSLFEKQIKENEKQIRKLKRKVFWTSAAGVAGIGIMAYLLITK